MFVRSKYKAWIYMLIIAFFCTACGGNISEARVEKHIEEDMQQVSIYNSNIRISGFPFLQEEETLTRIDKTLEGYSDGVMLREDKTAGGRIIVKTDSPDIEIEITLGEGETYPWFSLSGSVGVDVYKGIGTDKEWVGTYYPDNIEDKTILISLDNQEGVQQFTVNLPLYSGVEDVSIGVRKTSQLYPPENYSVEKPIVFYGSSITQGCSASRPGTSYPDMVTRYFDANLVNLGFSSSAKGEQVMAEMIASIDMSALVMEYDHNTDTPGELAETYKNFYRIIRMKHPDIPIIFLSRLSGGLSCSEEEAEERRAVIESVYEDAEAKGENVYYINGDMLLPADTQGDYFVDGKHPNDRGMAVMADTIIRFLEADFGSKREDERT